MPIPTLPKIYKLIIDFGFVESFFGGKKKRMLIIRNMIALYNCNLTRIRLLGKGGKERRLPDVIGRLGRRRDELLGRRRPLDRLHDLLQRGRVAQRSGNGARSSSTLDAAVGGGGSGSSQLVLLEKSDLKRGGRRFLGYFLCSFHCVLGLPRSEESSLILRGYSTSQ